MTNIFARLLPTGVELIKESTHQTVKFGCPVIPLFIQKMTGSSTK
jgi:hypothetical protein